MFTLEKGKDGKDDKKEKKDKEKGDKDKDKHSKCCVVVSDFVTVIETVNSPV